MAEEEVGALSVSVGLSASEFNRGIKEVSQRMQIAGQEFSNASAGLDRVADAAEISRLNITRLTGQIGAQQTIVDQLRTAHRNAAEQYGETSRQAQAYQLRLLRAEGSLQGMERQLIQTTNEIENMGEGAEESGLNFEEFGEKLKALGAVAAKVGAGIAAGLAIAGGAMLALVSDTTEAAKRIDKFSQVAGFSTKGFQEWDYVMKSLGYSMEDASGDMAALAEKALEAATGAGEGAEWFGMLGLTATDAGGKLKSQEQIFGEVITSLQGMEDVTKRNAIATALLGTTGEELGPILNMTGSELEAMKKKASELSLVMSQDAVDANVKYAKTVDELKGTVSGIGIEISNKLLPIFQDLLNWIIANMPAIKNEIEFAFNAAGKVITDVGVALEETKEFFEKHWGVVEPILAGIAAGAFTIGTVTVATKLWTLATQAGTLAQAALNFTMNLSPWAKVALLVGALVTAGVALYRNWDTVKEKASELWDAIGKAFVNGVNGAIDMINSLIEKINMIPGVNAPLISRVIVERTTKEKSDSFNAVRGIEGNADGTDYWPGGLTWVGEEGPELINLQRGAQVFTNSESMAMANRLKSLSPMTSNEQTVSSRSLSITINNQGTIVGSNGMNEFADIISRKIAHSAGLTMGGAW